MKYTFVDLDENEGSEIKILCYKLSQNGIYFPLHLNTVLDFSSSNDFNMKKNYLGKKLVDTFSEYLSTSNFDYYILDFKRISSAQETNTENDIFDKFFDSIGDNNTKPVYFINVGKNDSMRKFLVNNCNGKISKYHDILLANDINESKCKKLFGIVENLNNTVNKFVSSELNVKIKKCLSICVDKVDREQPSANIFGNYYVDIKRIFDQYNLFALTIYQLATIIQEHFGKDADLFGRVETYTFDGLICSSRNGAAITTILSQILDIQAVYLIAVGPFMSFREKEIFNKIEPNKKYLYIFDFISSGSEYKTTKAILSSKNAIICGGVGYSKYLDPNKLNNDKETRSEKIIVLNEVNDLLEVNEKYILYSEPELLAAYEKYILYPKMN